MKYAIIGEEFINKVKAGKIVELAEDYFTSYGEVEFYGSDEWCVFIRGEGRKALINEIAKILL